MSFDYQAPYTLPLRERIIQAVIARFEGVTSIAGDTSLSWDIISRDPLTSIEKKQRCMLALLEGKETNRFLASRIQEKALALAFEFEVHAFQGEDPNQFLVAVMADIEKVIGQDVTFGGLCLNMRVTSSQTDIDGDRQKLIGGILFTTMTYRHVAYDPTRAIGE